MLNDHAVELPLAQPSSLLALRRLRTGAHEACQIAFLLLYLVAAMTPQVRRALMGLDKV